MLIFLILFILIVVFIATGCIVSYFQEWYSDCDVPFFVCGFFTFIILIFLIIFCTYTYIVKDLTVEKYLMKYDILEEQLNNEFYKTEYIDQRQKLVQDVIEYNNDVMSGRFSSKSLWLNWFYPEDWESIPLIEFPKKGE